MINLVLIHTTPKSFVGFKDKGKYNKHIPINTIIEQISQKDVDKKILLDMYRDKYQKFVIDLETLELVAGKCDKDAFFNEEYFKNKPSEFSFINLQHQTLFMEYEYICLNTKNEKIWAKLENKHIFHIAWNFFPTWGSRKAKIIDFLLDDGEVV